MNTTKFQGEEKNERKPLRQEITKRQTNNLSVLSTYQEEEKEVDLMSFFD
jgi:hypothetical protein